MEIMSTEELKKELEKLKDFKVYVFEGDVYVKAEDYREKAIENRKLKEERDFFKEQAILWRKDYKNEYEENKSLKERVETLEERLDNKEKVNKSLREELKELNKMMLFETELEK